MTNIENINKMLFEKSIVIKMYFDFEEDEYSKIFDNEDFGFNQITVHQP